MKLGIFSWAAGQHLLEHGQRGRQTGRPALRRRVARGAQLASGFALAGAHARGRLPGGEHRRIPHRPGGPRAASTPPGGRRHARHPKSEGRLDLRVARGTVGRGPAPRLRGAPDEARQRFDESFEVLRLFFRGRPFYRTRAASTIWTASPPRPARCSTSGPTRVGGQQPLLPRRRGGMRGFPEIMNGAMRLVDLGEAMARSRARAAAAGFDAAAVERPWGTRGRGRAHAHRVMREPFLQFVEHRAPESQAYLAARCRRARGLVQAPGAGDRPSSTSPRAAAQALRAGGVGSQPPPYALGSKPDTRPPPRPRSGCAGFGTEVVPCSASPTAPPRSSLRRSPQSMVRLVGGQPRGRPRAA